jgi:non-heme chloroperoxidase
MEIQKLHGPQPPPPSQTDLASFSAFQKYYERINGFRFPEAELPLIPPFGGSSGVFCARTYRVSRVILVRNE